jgi:hypothetical protein
VQKAQPDFSKGIRAFGKGFVPYPGSGPFRLLRDKPFGQRTARWGGEAVRNQATRRYPLTKAEIQVPNTPRTNPAENTFML